MITRSENMSRIKRRDTLIELRARKIISSLGWRYRIDTASLPGRPDISNKRFKWAVFVNGCFWHQHGECGADRLPKSNREYWRKKLERNSERDASNLARLKAMQYAVLTLWECQKDLESRLEKFFSTEVSRNS